MVAAGDDARPARASPGSSTEAAAAGWQLAVASTSAEPSVRAVLEHAVGAELAARLRGLRRRHRAGQEAGPGDLPARGERARARRRPTRSWSRTARNGLLAALGAGLPCVVTRQRYTVDEDFTEAALVVVRASATRTASRSTVLADPLDAAAGRTASTSTTCAPASAGHASRQHQEKRMTEQQSQPQVELVVRTIAQTAVDNEKYFGDLDAVVGDGDFGYSLARGFENVLDDWDDIDRTDIGTFLKKIGDDHHLPDRRHVRPDLGHRVPAGRA